MTCSYEYRNVMHMKRVLPGFLVLLMLTPSLVCFMAFCPTQAKAEMLCHQDSNDDNSDLMFFSDCSGVDLQQANDEASLKKPDQSFELVFYDLAHLTAKHQFLNGLEKARAPPGYMDRSISFATPPVILTTQRFRI